MAGLAAAIGALFAGEKSTIKQNVLNKIDVSAISNVLSKNISSTNMTTVAGQNVIIHSDGCVGDINVNQNANVKIYIYNTTSTQIDQKLIQDVQQQIKDQLQQAVQQVDSSLFSMFQKTLTSEQISTINNVFNNTLQANVTAETISNLLTSQTVGQNVTIYCRNSVLPNGIMVNQNIQLDLTAINLVNSVIDQLAKSKQITDIVNDVQNKAVQEKTDFISKFVDVFGKYWFIFVAVIALVALIGLVIFIKLLSGGSQSQGQQYVMMQPRQYGPSPYGPSPYGPNPYGRAGPIGPGPRPVMYAPRR